MDPVESAPEAPLVLSVGCDSLLRDALALEGFRVEHAEDGPTCLGVFEELLPDVVLVDLHAKGMDGPEVCEALGKLPGGRHSGVVLLVDTGDVESTERAFLAGATDIVARGVGEEFIARRLRFVRRAARTVQAQDSRRNTTDRVTGFEDRGRFLERLAHATAQARAESSSLAVLSLELDRFRELVYGIPRESVDLLLASVARRLSRGTRESDTLSGLKHCPGHATIARVGGGEFTVLLEGLARTEDAALAARRLLDELTGPIDVGGREITVGASIGIATLSAESETPEELLSRAQTAAFVAKQEGQDTIRYHQESMNARAFERLSLESSLRHALEREEFRVHYQPRIDVSTGALLSFEALVRWQHPELGLVAPGQFIPMAEETGLIVPIGEWVLRTACAQNRAWQKHGLGPVTVSVNLSGAQFRRPDLFDTVVRVLGETGLDPRWLELELTESLLMQNAEAVVGTLKRFRDTGIHLSIDDFGTGYSSLAYLKRFPIDALKIDRSFICEVTTNADDAALATSIILMGRSLKLKVVAEGVETESQHSFLRIMQCDEAQGFLYSRPVPAAEAETFLRDGLPKIAAA